MLQRVGRADHRLGGIGGHLLSWDFDIAESAVVETRAMLGQIESIEWASPTLCYGKSTRLDGALVQCCSY